MKEPPHDGTDMSHQARLVKYSDVSTALALLSDHQLGRIVDAGQDIGSGVGGTSALLDVAGAPVFVKRIPLTDVERHPQNLMSTANVFGLPTFCQYGVVAYSAGGHDYIRRCAAGARPIGAPAPVAELISRYAPVAAIMNDFYWDVFGVSRTTPYPAQDLARAMAVIPDFAPAPPTGQTVSEVNNYP
ncbi:MAG TPA: hypothetical protein VHV74_17115 [Pseudonocardiaceae bacterium]|nr:hypothetical protein [Pseudonocardiaceae bacterium]